MASPSPKQISQIKEHEEERREEQQQLLAAPQPIPKLFSRENDGGYDCEFVEQPPKAFQTECYVCLQILKEPCLISCCGTKFCCGCIERVKKIGKPCPLCSVPEFTSMRDGGLERSLKDLDVWCSYKKKGCGWKGKLRDVEGHLNKDPSPGNELNGCLFEAVECTYKCDGQFLRQDINTHKTQWCKNRPFSCEYCHNYMSTYEDVTENHWPKCDSRPITCPNGCSGTSLSRDNLDKHLKKDCILTKVQCPFHYAGCPMQLLRKDVQEHLVQENVAHVTLLSIFTQKLGVENQRLVEANQNLIKENQELHQRVHENEGKMRQDSAHLHGLLTGQVNEQKQELERVKADFARKERATLVCYHNMRHGFIKLQTTKTVKYVETHTVFAEELHHIRGMYLPKFPVEFRVEDLQRRRESWFSAPFFTHSRGYQMCLNVELKFRHGKLLCVSIFICILKGPFDNELKWPFRGSLEIRIVDQVTNNRHCDKVITYTNKAPKSYAGRLTDRNRSDAWGFKEFISGPELDRIVRPRRPAHENGDFLLIHVTPVKKDKYG